MCSTLYSPTECTEPHACPTDTLGALLAQHCKLISRQKVTPPAVVAAHAAIMRARQHVVLCGNALVWWL